MSIYVGDKKAKLYKGDHHPARFFKGGTKIAGYDVVQKQGEEIVCEGTYNDQLNPTIEGKSEQTVTANSPSPDYPSPIRSSENFDVVSCGRDPATATTAHILDPLCSVGDVSDSIEVSGGKVEVVRRCGVKSFDGSEAWTDYNAAGNTEIGCNVFYISLPETGKCPDMATSVCSHAKWVKYGYADKYSGCCHSLNSGGYTLMFKTNLETTTTAASFKGWVSAQATAGNPVTVQYPIATPTRTDITSTPLGQALLAMQTMNGFTRIYTNAAIKPQIAATIKTLGE